MNSIIRMLLTYITWVTIGGLEVLNRSILISAASVNLTITTKPFSIMVMRKKVVTNKGQPEYNGVCFDIFNLIAKRNNLTYNFGPVDEDLSGFGMLLENNTWTGMVGAILYGDADIAINEFTRSAQRSAVVDFSTSFRGNRLVLVLKNPEYNSILLTRPFECEVWLFRIAVFTGFIISVLFINRWSSSKQSQTSGVQLVLQIFSGQFMQGMDDSIIRNSHHLQFAFIGWLIGSFFLAAAYTSNLKAMFSVEKQPMRAESLAEALEVPEFEMLLGKDSFEHQIFKEGKSYVYREGWKRITTSKDNLMADDDLYLHGCEMITRRTNLGMLIAEVEAIRLLGLKQNYQLYIAKEPVIVSYGHLIWTKSFQYANLFNREITRLVETGKNNYEQLCM